MRRGSANHYRAMWLLLGAMAWASTGPLATAQDGSQTSQLLSKAHALEVRGRMDMARDTWKQVLLVDPNNPEALAGLARAAKSEGHPQEAAEYLERLRAIRPNDPSIGQVQGMSSNKDRAARLQEAGRLARSGQYDRAMDIQRELYGNAPPSGDEAIGYYETMASTQEGKIRAAAGLRSLVARFPQEQKYQIALGKVLTYNPRTRAEGRKILERYPYDPGALQALRDSLSWDVQNPAAAGSIRAYLSQHNDPQLANELEAASHRYGGGGRVGRPPTPEQRAERAANSAQTAEERAAYAALNAHRYDEAARLFEAIRAKHPKSCPALAGSGYVDMAKSNFSGALSFFVQAEEDGCRNPALKKALDDSRFFNTIQIATAALNSNDLFTAEKEFELARKLRPGDPSALVGLGGTFLKAEQPEQAIPIFLEDVKRAPGDPRAWNGLMMAQFAAKKYNDGLETERRIPPQVRVQLRKDPDYLRTLASLYAATGRDAEAQRILQEAVNLPFPQGGHGLKVDVQLQYAALLAAAGRRQQAAGLYRQVTETDPQNVNGWVGLVQMEHLLGRDAEAYAELHKMPPQSFAAAMQEAGFETTVAAIYEGVGHDEVAQEILEKFLAKQQAEGKKPFVPAQLQLASLYIRHGNAAQAYPLYQAVLRTNPDRADAWAGLLSALHSTGHDTEALAQVQQIPPAVRRSLESDPSYLEVVGSIYSGLGDTRQAAVFFERVQQHYAALHIAPPADVQIQQAWMLYNAGADGPLYHQLMTLGSRQDLTDRQRLTVQEIWTNWAVKRAGQNAAAGDYRRAIAILNATAKTFPGNPKVINALAGGYAAAGMPKEAVVIFRAQDMSAAASADYSTAVGAALAANDLRDAELWLRFGLERYPREPQLLMLAAKFEEARGDPNRAADYYRTLLATVPPSDPGAQLATELSHPAPLIPAPLPSASQPQDMATLLSQPDRPVRGAEAYVAPRPYLPGYNSPSVSVPVPMNGGYGQPYAPEWAAPQAAPNGYGYPAPSSPGTQPGTASPSTLKDYVPQSRLRAEPALPGAAATEEEALIHLHPSPAMEARYGPYVSYDPSAGVPHFANAPRLLGDGVMVTVTGAPQGTTAHLIAAAYHLQQGPAQQQSPAQNQDATPTVQYIPPVHPIQLPPPTSARSRAAAIRANQAQGQGGMTGQSHPPTDAYPQGSVSNTQFSSQPYDPAQAQQQGSQVPQPTTRPGATAPRTTTQQPTVQQFPQGQSLPQGGGYGQAYPNQQYPQPGSGNGGGSGGGRRPSRPTKPSPSAPAEPGTPAPVTTSGPPMSYPSPGQPLGNEGPPQINGAYQQGLPPSDYDLQQRNLPPLRGYFDPRVDERTPLTPRQQAELALATIDGSYSGWIGGTAIGHYRSGRSGIDRLASLEVPIEISLVAGRTLRLSIVPRVVFLNSGQLDTTAGDLGNQPVLGTLPGNALVPPAQQFASGVGGEVQIATNTFAGAVGVTPYQFLVNNVIGRAQWRPLNGHFMFYGARDAVKQTQLSYAGLRDPGSASAVYSGNVWGGVISTGGGIRFDAGGARSGVYAQGGGAALTGYHVLDNRTFDGTLGMYFRAKAWPEYGTLTVGALFYGAHFQHNERGQTYGLGGYFSPEAYFLAAVPVGFAGHYGKDIHYSINSSLGVQTFQEDNQIYFPLNPALETSTLSSCTVLQITARTCGQMPVNSNTGLNYSLDTQISYRVNEHWFVGGFLSANNTNNYNSVTGGFSARYMFRPQVAAPQYPTGLFPVEGFRPLLVP